MSGKKTIETRTWRTTHRGKLLIVSSKRFHEDFDPTGPHVKYLPLGQALGIVNLKDCRPMTERDEEAACCELYDGAWAWLIEALLIFQPTFPVRGQLRLFNVNVANKNYFGCLIFCPQCGSRQEVKDEDTRCSKCGFELGSWSEGD